MPRSLLVLLVLLFVLTTLSPRATPGDEPDAAALQKMLPDLHLLEPFWRSAAVYRESLLFVQDDEKQPASGTLLFSPGKILAVHSAAGQRQYAADKDFAISGDGRRLVLTTGSPIPFLKTADLFPPKGSPRSIQHKAGDPNRHVLFDNEHWFHDQQLEVTYTRQNETWPGYVPALAEKQLPKTLAKLRGRGNLTLAVSGDSISNGYNASAFTKTPPFMPPYPNLVAAQLEASYGGKVTLHNRAVGGWSTKQGLADLDKLLETKPDLVIIAYGMNDVGRRDPLDYQKDIREMLRRIRAAYPNTEVILVATMLGNADWVHTPREMFPKYRDALAQLCGDGVALADLTALWTDMLKTKRELDLQGNGVNHPCDHGHRLYAQVILSLLVAPSPEKK